MTARAELFPEETRLRPTAAPPGWSGLIGLLSMIARAVDAVEWFGKRGHFVCNGQCYPQETLMRVLTFCRVTGAIVPEAMAQTLAEHPGVRRMCAGEVPDGETLTQFGEVHGEPLERCLRELWSLSADLAFGCSTLPGGPADDHVVIALDRWVMPLQPPALDPDEATRFVSPVMMP